MSTGHAPLPGGTPPSGLSEAAPPQAEPPECHQTLGTSNGLPPDLSQRPAIVPGREVTGDTDAHCYITIQPPSPPPPPQRFEDPFLAAATAGDELRLRPCDNWDTSIALKDVLEQLRREGVIKNVQSTEREELRQWQAVGQWRVPFLLSFLRSLDMLNQWQRAMTCSRSAPRSFTRTTSVRPTLKPPQAALLPVGRQQHKVTCQCPAARPWTYPSNPRPMRPTVQAVASQEQSSKDQTESRQRMQRTCARPPRPSKGRAPKRRQTRHSALPAPTQTQSTRESSPDIPLWRAVLELIPVPSFRPPASELPPLRLPPRTLQLPRPASTSTNSLQNSDNTLSDHSPLEPLRPPASPPIPLQSMPRPPGTGQQFEFKFEYASQGANSSSTVTSDPKPHDSRGPEPAKMVFVGGRSQGQQHPPLKKPGAGPARKRKDKDKAAPGPSTSRG